MTMAAAGCKQGIILDRLWTALLLVSSKGPREASKLTKRPTDQIFDEKKLSSDFFGKTVFHLGTVLRQKSKVKEIFAKEIFGVPVSSPAMGLLFPEMADLI